MNGYGSKQRRRLKRALIRRDGSLCARCGVDGPLTIDHVVPLARGGVHAQSNLQLLCRPCNETKANRTIRYAVEVAA